MSGVAKGSGGSLLLKGGDGDTGVGCNDAGLAPDRLADGVYTCFPLPRLAPPTELFLLHEAGVAAAGDAVDGAGEHLHLALDGGTLRVEASRPEGASGAGGGAGTLLLIHLVGVPAGPLPMLTVTERSGAYQLRCRDDGGFPDLLRNDGEPGCAGHVLGAEGVLSMNSATGPRSLGTVQLDGKLAWLRVDAANGTITPEAEALPLAGRDLPPSPPPAPTPGEPTPIPGQPTPTPGGPTPTPGGPAPPPTSTESPAGALQEPPKVPWSSALLWLGLAGGAAAAGLAWQRHARRNPLPGGLLPLSPPQAPGGAHTLTGRGLVVEGDEMEAVAAMLLARAAASRRVILVSEANVAAPSDSAGIWRSSSVDCLEVAAMAGKLGSTPGAPVAVVVVGAQVLRDPGGVVPQPLPHLLAALPPGVWLGIALRPGESADCDLPRESDSTLAPTGP